jgi:hypothetical protein
MLSAGIALAAVAAVGFVVWLLGGRDRAAEAAAARAQVPLQRRSVSPDEARVFRSELRARYEAELREREQEARAQA